MDAIFSKRKLIFILNVGFLGVCVCLFFETILISRQGKKNLIFYDELTAQTPEREAKISVFYLGLKAESGLCTYPVCRHGAFLNSQSTRQCTRAWALNSQSSWQRCIRDSYGERGESCPRQQDIAVLNYLRDADDIY